jgi:hypothetical protein
MLTSLPSKRIVPCSRDRLDQRRLTGAVVANQGDDLAGIHVEVDVDQSPDRPELLADAPALEQRHTATAKGRRDAVATVLCRGWDER